MMRPTFREALDRQRPLVTPLAHDALSARLIELAGFRAFAVGGSAMLAARFGLPDLGLVGLADMVTGMREVAEATGLPFVADADDGYGDVKSVARTVRAYERLGVGGMLIEDQDRDVKQQRAERAVRVVEEAVILDKLKVALATRSDPETFIIGRTDAYGALGLDAALHRAERFLAIGVEGVFVAGLRTEADYARVGRELGGARLSTAMFDSGSTPWITPAVLAEMGFSHVSYPQILVLRIVHAMRSALDELHGHATGTGRLELFEQAEAARETLDRALKVQDWRSLAGHAAPQHESSPT